LDHRRPSWLKTNGQRIKKRIKLRHTDPKDFPILIQVFRDHELASPYALPVDLFSLDYPQKACWIYVPFSAWYTIDFQCKNGKHWRQKAKVHGI
jgi:hypothetical protein